MKEKRKFFFYLIAILFFDFIFTSFFFKNTSYWDKIDNKYFPKKYWRIESSLFHHDLKKNINVKENWGNYKYELITNSLGFRDKLNRRVEIKNSKKKRIYVNGDSFIEGVGFDYDDTVIGLLDSKFNENYEILNSAVVSYSPSIYYSKTKYYINKGLVFDYCLVFLDISDIPDENFIEEDSDGKIFDIRKKNNENSLKQKIYSLSRLYRDNFITGKIIGVLREVTGNYKSQIKKKILTSKNLNKSFFKINEDDINLYKSTHIDRSMWTYDKKYSKKWKSKGLTKSSNYLTKLFNMLNEHNIESYLVIYPNPGQILLNEENIHEKYWTTWSLENNVNLINLYKYFSSSDKSKTIHKYFIPGDVHWNLEGHLLVFNALLTEVFNNF